MISGGVGLRLVPIVTRRPLAGGARDDFVLTISAVGTGMLFVSKQVVVTLACQYD